MRTPLGDLLLDLLAIPSVTGEEARLATWLEQRYRHEDVRRVGDSVLVGARRRGDRPLVALVAHTDTVPPATVDDLRPRREDERLVGRGASDMKAGLAVALDCLEDPSLRAGPYDLLLVAYAREEGPHAENELADVLTADEALRGADLAIVLEPTDLEVQLGCMGTLHAEVAFTGRAAHSARPWHGTSALTAAAPLLAALHERPAHEVAVDDLVFREVLVPTQAATGNARNVVPDAFTVSVNYRYAPDKDAAEAEARVREELEELAAGADGPVVGRAEVTISVTDHAPAGRPSRDHPLVARFLEAVPATVAPKQAWTDVGRLSEAGVPALNFGPGLTAQAHQAGEYVREADLSTCRKALAAFLLRG